MQIGLAGTGKMGSAMARRLLACGHAVRVWNRTPARAQPLLDAGATAADTLQTLVQDCDVVITMLTDEAALDSVYGIDGGAGGGVSGDVQGGATGLLAAPLQGRLLIDMSTVGPAKPQAIGPRVVAAGGRFLECPVGGSVGPAAEGKLLGFVGGAADDLASARAVLDVLCRRVEHVGGWGAGATMKLAINLPLLVYWQTLSEALSLLQPLGLDPARVIDILADTSGGPNMLKTRGPMIAKALAGTADGAVSVDLATLAKDLRTMLAQGAAQNLRLPLTAATLHSFEQAMSDGLAEADCTQLPVWWLQGANRA